MAAAAAGQPQLLPQQQQALGGSVRRRQAAAPPPELCYALPAGARVVLVEDAAGLDQLEAALSYGERSSVATAQDPPALSAGSSDRSSKSSGNGSAASEADEAPRGFGDEAAPGGGSGGYAAPRLTVGLDAEWEPYERDQPRTLVSLLQLATSNSEIFLVDMLALAGDNPSSGDHPTPLQQRLSDVLLRLFGDPAIVVAGFGLENDLISLCASYPAMPCFGGLGAVPLR